MKCKTCNFENPDNAVKCKQCGAKLSDETKTSPNISTDTVVLDASTQLNVDPLSFAPGEKFGERYQIIEEIGQGGMGKVFKAKDTELDIVVALKMIKPQLSSDPDIVSRFKRELLMAREVFHENVIRIHDLGEVSGIKYISMNYIEGNSLKEVLQTTGKLTIEKSLDIAKQVGSALEAAHKKGIIHRDLKPQNVMIDKQGKAYVLDFGIARSLRWEPDAAQDGIVLGTPDFMSPEQIKGEKADATTDIYSLGIILYEMVTGKLPFTGDSPTELLHKHLNIAPEPPSKLNPQIPPLLEKIILKCLEKKKKHRYQSVKEVLQDVESDKTIEISPMKVKEVKEPPPPKERKFLKYGLRTVIFLVFVYAIISVLSLVNDSLYKGKIEKNLAVYETHYKDIFPIRKDWLPGVWEIKDCNAWETYAQLFPPPPSPKPGAGEDETETWGMEFDKIAIGFEYGNVDDLNDFIGKYEKHFQFDPLREAVKCSKLNSFADAELKRMPPLHLPMVRRYADMVAIKARVDFCEGNYEEGLDKLHHFMIFTMDLFAGSTRLAEQQMALSCFNKICQELIPLLLSRDISLNTLSPYELECLAVFGNFKPGLFPFSDDYNTPPEQERINLPTLHSFETLIVAALNKFESEPILYSENLNLVKNYQNIYDTMGMGKNDYYIYGKLKFLKHWFSINRYFYKKGIEFYQGLLEYMKGIGGMRDRSVTIANYYKEHSPVSNILIADLPRAALELNKSRTLGKLILIINTINRHGIESKEFSDLKGTDRFINELTGNNFEIIEEGPFSSVILDKDKDFKLPLKKINYEEDHKKILQYLRQFEK
ncbi:MAG: protein kinase [Candidatus Aminicenantes bacterium]|nr:protein kinase [Candidatus Aminicenantes bacterium]NIQ73465.1 protein kinase [Candidatus Aminicenantes bacterium]NIT29534.1 protein kinase [Candidatus Aminicenantes bacterium]